ncbi:MAG: HEAT repeat domain-containing protein [Prevotellaceae bacterium]|jgi:hypothetical protein|nr:HEAT repeat domain-containing protein [Prevotellaceae bacterium]
MKLLPLYDLQQEINRLFIAGSKFAQNDPRLQKQAVIFNKLGEKSPVFKKIAGEIDSLAGADVDDSSMKLLELSTLLYAVLYTQGEPVDAEQPETELTPALSLKDVGTDESYLAIRPLIEALSSRKGGRLNDLKKAFKKGQFRDFRVYRLLDTALSDHYADFADYIETVVIPTIGPVIMPFIAAGFSYEGKPDDARRFRILYKLGYPGIAEMVDVILAGKSVPLLTEAVKTLGNDRENEELLVQFAGDRHKSVRLAAYETLAKLNTETAQRTLVDLFISDKRKAEVSELGKVLKMNLSDKFIPALLTKAKAAFEECLNLNKSSDKKAVTGAFENFTTGMNPLLNNVNEDVLKFYRDVFTDKKYEESVKIFKSKTNFPNLPQQIAYSVINSLKNTKEGVECLEFLVDNSSFDDFLYSRFMTSVKNRTDKKSVYERFAKYADRLIAGNMLVRAFCDEDGKLNPENMDNRWTKFFHGN